MIYLIFYGILVLFVFLFALLLFIYSLFSVVAQLMGSPYVPTKQKEVEHILKTAGLKKGQLLIELGSGDGRMIRTAVSRYKVHGIGVEIHPLLLFWSHIFVRLQKLTSLPVESGSIIFKRENFFKTNVSKADAIFLFLMPNTLKKLRDKFINECKKNTLIISHGFKIEGWEGFLQHTIHHTPFPTYFYRILS
ncbi:MAG TPA: hypothetical protein VJB63_00885 [Patescibacteria group bacterium]|nr:hypothetical protein [Patescibacteria group bacterium]